MKSWTSLLRKAVLITLVCIFPITSVACGSGAAGKDSVKEVSTSTTAIEKTAASQAEATRTTSTQTAADAASKEESLLADNILETVGQSSNEYGEMKIVDVTGQPFTKALQVKTIKQPDNPWDFGISSNIDKPVKQGEVILVTFYARTLESSNEGKRAQTEFVSEIAQDPWTKSAAFLARPGQEWQQYQVPFVEQTGNDSVPMHIAIRFGYTPQTIEIAGLKFVNYGMYKNIKDLPRTKVTYGGQEADAPWRKAAEERIDKYRKADLTVVVKGKDGKIVNGAAVEVKMLKHEFGFGTAVNPAFFIGNDKDSDNGKKYQDGLLKYFNKIVIENDLKWDFWENSGKESGVKAVDWLLGKGFTVRGHNLVWDGSAFLPKDVQALTSDPEKLRKRINDHINEEATLLKGKLVDWDVVNEPIDNHIVRDVLGSKELAGWYKQVRRIDPKAKLYINEWGMEDYDYSTRMEKFIPLMEQFLKDGAPIDGIGIQAHFGATPVEPELFIKSLDRLAKFGKEMEITEYDMDSNDEQLQADFMRDMLTASFSHPNVKSFMMWGFWDGAHWHNNAPIYRKDWSLKPSGQVWEDLIYKQWWTNAAGNSDKNGKYTTRGFKGEYEITVKYNGVTKVVNTKLTRNSTLKVDLK